LLALFTKGQVYALFVNLVLFVTSCGFDLKGLTGLVVERQEKKENLSDEVFTTFELNELCRIRFVMWNAHLSLAGFVDLIA